VPDQIYKVTIAIEPAPTHVLFQWPENLIAESGISEPSMGRVGSIKRFFYYFA
jgi:hypothetical protein